MSVGLSSRGVPQFGLGSSWSALGLDASASVLCVSSVELVGSLPVVGQ